MHVFCRSDVYYDNVESLFGLKCHFVLVYQYQSDNCCRSVTGAVNNQQLVDIYLAVFLIQLKSHLVWDLYILRLSEAVPMRPFFRAKKWRTLEDEPHQWEKFAR